MQEAGIAHKLGEFLSAMDQSPSSLGVRYLKQSYEESGLGQIQTQMLYISV